MNRFDTLYLIILLQCIAACKNNSSPIYQNDCPDYYPVTLYERLYELASTNQEQSLVDSILQIDPFSIDLIRFNIQLYHDKKQLDSIDNYFNQLTSD